MPASPGAPFGSNMSLEKPVENAAAQPAGEPSAPAPGQPSSDSANHPGVISLPLPQNGQDMQAMPSGYNDYTQHTPTSSNTSFVNTSQSHEADTPAAASDAPNADAPNAETPAGTNAESQPEPTSAPVSEPAPEPTSEPSSEPDSEKKLDGEHDIPLTRAVQGKGSDTVLHFRTVVTP